MIGPETSGDPQTAEQRVAAEADGEEVPMELDRPGPRLRFQPGQFQPDPDLRGKLLPPGYRAAHLVGVALLVTLGLAVLAVVIGLGLPGLVWDAGAWFVQLLPFVP